MYLGMHLLSEIVQKRPVLLTNALYALLDFSYHETAEVSVYSLAGITTLLPALSKK